MSKNTSSSAFRKIDVDQYNEDNFKEEEGDGGTAGPDENEIITLLGQGKNVEALISVLKSAPLGCKNQQVKDNALNLTLKVLLSIKSNQIEDAVAKLDRDLVDVLMKYIYRGFEIPSEGSSGHLLLWHEKVYNVGGVGSIVRVLSDSKQA
ncbi:actin-related protein 2/3 complex subunit 5 [Neodiprion pinetum]|uniref:Actin-related protein 2/3 complex subunit 5 n=1 Tax=Neodiprion lecontei TaxID=441921 RepID=A0A6J0BQI3_NEOLC|nr:actin-related protein 2/3 complex subunit 5 [Neodiprion lecontei]XP_046412946.1 actin-related protein 2/3 complex subunit 5 [Neodiprion fabricii]XP_046467394.1 actin-related protein 2/3 complex subunit 5 [Neodiprion pinetum]XP_046606140.1 actin-related protein 2/3 complex subunit 5 [Neodiprion virginianus]